jgi:hypothetical protein
VFTNGSIPGTDILALAPFPEGFTVKWLVPVDDDVPWSFASPRNGFAQECPDINGRGLLLEYGKPDNATGEMVDSNSYPPTERPALQQGEGEP